MKKSVFRRLVAILLVLCLGFNISGWESSAKTSDSEEGIDQMVKSSVDTSTGWDGVTREKDYTGEGFKVLFSLKDTWDDGFNASVKIKNTGDSTIENWSLMYDYQGEINSVWNGVLKSSGKENGRYCVKNAGWNQDITSGECVEFGINGKGAFIGFPSEYKLLGHIRNNDKEQFDVDYRLVSDWGSGYSATISMVNKTDDPIEDWVLEFDFDREISEIWNGAIRSHEGNHYVIRNADYNSIIGGNSSVSFGFNGNGGNKKNEPYNCELYSYSDDEFDLEDLIVSLDTDSLTFCESEDGDFYTADEEIKTLSGTINHVDGIDEMRYEISDTSDVLKKGDININENWKIANFGLGSGYNTLDIIVSKRGATKRFSFVIVNSCIENMNNAGIDLKKDSDGDNMPDYFEKKYGLNANEKDSDGDGLDDYMEFLIPNISPTSLDGDENGVNDTDEDYDGDGITNYDEVHVCHTNYSLEDTDSDSLTDFEEINKYKTDPNKEDTDGDGLNDGDEISLGTDPLIFDESFSKTVELESDDDHPTSVKVTVDTLTADQVDSFMVARSANWALTDKNIPGYIDDGYNFTVDGKITEAEVEVTYDKSLEKGDFEPALYYYDTEKQFLEPVENQRHEKGKVIAHLEHFSEYILINKIIYSSHWDYKFIQKEIDNRCSGLDIAFVIDDSGSMSWNDKQNQRLDVINKFTERMADVDRAAIISFTDRATVLCDFTNNTEKLKESVKGFRNSGGTTLSSGVNSAIYLFDKLKHEENRLKYIIMLTDGDGYYSNYYSNLAKEKGIIIHSVGLGSNVVKNKLIEMSEITGGQYYHADNSADLFYIFDTIADEADYYKDSDGDGISDYYEKEMAAGHLVLGNGTPITSVSFLNEDSDSDGLKDGEEISVQKYNKKLYVRVKSNPGIVDTDGDGLNDEVDPYPLFSSRHEDDNTVVYQSENFEGLKKKSPYFRGVVADDLTFNDRDLGGDN